MTGGQCLGNTCWLGLLVVVAVFAAAGGISILLGADALNACFWAIVVSGIAACGGFIPIAAGSRAASSLSIASVLASGAIRLLLALAGVVIIILFVKVNAMWFAAWLGLFYVVMLGWEVWLATRIINKHTRTGAAKV